MKGSGARRWKRAVKRRVKMEGVNYEKGRRKGGGKVQVEGKKGEGQTG